MNKFNKSIHPKPRMYDFLLLYGVEHNQYLLTVTLDFIGIGDLIIQLNVLMILQPKTLKFLLSIVTTSLLF